MAKKLKPMHPGEVLREEFLVPLKMSAGALAKTCGLSRTRIERIASEQTGICRRYGASARQGTRHNGTALAQSTE
jgi:plasmid maintenance system antidote protein VapI